MGAEGYSSRPLARHMEVVNIFQTLHLVSDLCSVPTENILFKWEMHRPGYLQLAVARELRLKCVTACLSEDLSQLRALSCLELSVFLSSLRTLCRDSDPFIHSGFYPWLIPSI